MQTPARHSFRQLTFEAGLALTPAISQALIDLLKDPAKSQKVMATMMPMKKIDIATLQRAAAG